MEQVATFSERFAELVGDKSYADVGKEIDVSKATVCAYINGTREPKTPVLKSIARTYNVSPNWLLGFDVPKRSSAEEDDLDTYLDVLRTRPECRMLFSLTKDATKEDVERAVAVIEALKGKV